jgi:dephospho-CoA kinase
VDDGSAYNESLAIASQFVEKNRDLLIKTKAVVKHEFNKKVNSEWMEISEKLRREVGQHPAHREALHRFVHRKR